MQAQANKTRLRGRPPRAASSPSRRGTWRNAVRIQPILSLTKLDLRKLAAGIVWWDLCLPPIPAERLLLARQIEPLASAEGESCTIREAGEELTELLIRCGYPRDVAEKRARAH